MSDNIIFITPEEQTEHWDVVSRKLWEENFDDSEEYCDFYFKERWRVSSAFFIGEKSMMHLCPYSLFFCDKEIFVNYLVGVCTVSYERRKGYMARLLGECFKMLYLDSVPFLYLMPADTKIYTPFGFRSFYDVSVYRGSLDNAIELYMQEKTYLKNKAVKKEISDEIHIKIKEYSQLTTNERDELSDFSFHKLKSSVHCFVKRDAGYFELRADEMKSCKGALLTFWNMDIVNRPIGYVMLMREDGVEISEFLVEEGFEYFILKMLGDVLTKEEKREICICDTMFLDKLSGVKKKLLMGRIVCLEKFIALFNTCSSADKIYNILEGIVGISYACNSGMETNKRDIYLDITDKLIHENSGLWKFALEKNKIGIFKIEGSEIETQNQVTKINIEELFEFIMEEMVFYLNEMV